MRKPEEVSRMLEIGSVVFLVVLGASLFMSRFRPVIAGGDGGEEDALAGRSASKSVWEGGTKGVQKSLKRGQTGLRAERERQESGEGLEMPAEMVLNPGLV